MHQVGCEQVPEILFPDRISFNFFVLLVGTLRDGLIRIPIQSFLGIHSDYPPSKSFLFYGPLLLLIHVAPKRKMHCLKPGIEDGSYCVYCFSDSFLCIGFTILLLRHSDLAGIHRSVLKFSIASQGKVYNVLPIFNQSSLCRGVGQDGRHC